MCIHLKGFKYCYLTNSFICTQLNGFKHCCVILTIQFRHIIKKFLNSYIWPIDWILTGTTTLGQSGPGGNGNEGVPNILQSWILSIRCNLMSYLGHTLGWGSFTSAEMHLLYSTACTHPLQPTRLQSYFVVLNVKFKLLEKLFFSFFPKSWLSDSKSKFIFERFIKIVSSFQSTAVYWSLTIRFRLVGFFL